jgi:hypothetical protein
MVEAKLCVLAASDDASPLVREIALTSLASAAPDQVGPVAEECLTDVAPTVRRQAALIATKQRAASS